MKRPPADWATLRAALWERSGGRCEASGLLLDVDTFDSHHRRPKGMGGTYRPDTDLLTNLLALDPIVHNMGPASVHANRRWSETRGYLLPKLSMYAPSAMPIYLHGVQWVWLTLSGTYRKLPLSG